MKSLISIPVLLCSALTFAVHGSDKPVRQPHYLSYLAGWFSTYRPEIIQSACVAAGFYYARNQKVCDNVEEKRLAIRCLAIGAGSIVGLIDNHTIHIKQDDNKKIAQKNESNRIVFNNAPERNNGRLMIIGIGMASLAASIAYYQSQSNNYDSDIL